MKCCNHLWFSRNLYLLRLIPVGVTSRVETVKTLSSSKNKSSNLFQVFLRNVFYHNSCWPCFIIGNRIRVRVIVTSVYIELGMKNASLFCLFYLIKYSWGSEWMCAFLYWSGSQLKARNYWTLTINFSSVLGIFTASVSQFLERR